MSLVDDLTASALLGTDRRPPAAPAGEGALGAALVAQPWSEDPAAAVLAATALATTHHRAGIVAAPFPGELPTPAPPEPAAASGPGAAALLDRLLVEPDGAALVHEWLERVAARGERAPAITLPTLLDRATGTRTLRSPVLRAGGERLRWLARQRTDWDWAADRVLDEHEPESTRAPAGSAQRWATGTAETRVLLLTDLRAGDPAAARDLVESTWEQDPPEQRARFIGALRDGLGPADEPLLERALADRRQEVRHAALELLAALPGSAFRSRMAARLRPLVEIEGRLRPRLVLELPPPLDPEAKRDGVREQQRGLLGPRAAHLSDLVAGAGLDLWAELTGKPDPADVLRLASGNEQFDALLHGWRAAAERERSAAWSAALAIRDQNLEALASLAPADAEAAAITISEGIDPAIFVVTVPALQQPWGPGLSAAVVRAIGLVRTGNVPHGAMREIAAALDAGSLPSAVAALAKSHPVPSPAIAVLLHLLDLRQSLIRELPTS
jgi:hypothetical protein